MIMRASAAGRESQRAPSGDLGAGPRETDEDRAGAEESNRAAAAWLAENLPDLDIAPPQVTAGEAVIDF
jgi:hypothetical protein